jgi:UDP-N-acetylglucosamine 1-carboxyvinyltransferase
VAGAKNAALPALAASLLTDQPLVLHNVPRVRDVSTMFRVLDHLGGEAVSHDDHGCRVQVSSLKEPEAPYELVKTMRASVLVLGPLVARFGRARVSMPGGCAIGERPIGMHLSALRRLGATIDLNHGYVDARAGRLRAASIPFEQKTVTGTENIMMAAALADGVSVLENCAREPEVTNLAELLRSMGARIEGDGTDTIRIEGVASLHGAEHSIIPDRIEAATFAMAPLMTGGEVTVQGCRTSDLSAAIGKLRDAGAAIADGEDRMTVRLDGALTSRDVTTAPHPGFPTDLQAQYMAVMTQATGGSLITEAIFENRFMHVGELRRMGAEITHDGRRALVKGPARLAGAQVMATDLRASACLVLAALAAEGVTEIHRVYHIDRGYERIEERLLALGADIERVRS